MALQVDADDLPLRGETGEDRTEGLGLFEAAM